MKTKVIAVVGPTASGKTALAVELCKRFDGEVVSADSMQIYSGLDIATAKPSETEMSGIPHHMISFLSPKSSYSVGQYVLDAYKVIDDIRAGGKLPVICGGTGLYIDSLINGIEFSDDSSDESIREDLYRDLENKGVDFLLDELRKFDPEAYDRLRDGRNPKRIIRAIEFFCVTGKTITTQIVESRLKEPKLDAIIFGLTSADRSYLYDRINRRVDLMIEQGLLNEAESVLKSDLSSTAKTAIGYRQLAPYFKGEADLEECVDRIKTETRRYAKRQLTWFRRNEDIIWINIDEIPDVASQADLVCEIINSKGFLNG